MSGAPSSSEPVADPPAPAGAAADVSADSALILAALGRLETAVRDERAVLARLRRSLADMAHAIARAKAVADSETSAIMLDEFEHRVDAMIELAGGANLRAPEAPPVDVAAPVEAAPQPEATMPAIEPVAEHDHVPTVSDVVSRFGPTVADSVEGEAPPAEAHEPPVADDAADRAHSVAMLTAMVEALRDSITAAPEPVAEATEASAPEPVAEAPAPEVVEQLAPEATEEAVIQAAEEPVVEEPVIEEPAIEEPALQPSEESAPEAAVEPAFAPIEEPALQAIESAPPEAVRIEWPAFESAPAEEHSVPAPEAAIPEVTAVAPPADVTPDPLPVQALLHETSLLASFERMDSRPFPPPDEGTAVIFTRRSAAEFLPAFAPDPPPEEATPEPAAEVEAVAPEPLPPATAEIAPPEAAQPEAVVPAMATPEVPAVREVTAAPAEEFDPADFLFEPEPEPEPAAKPAALLPDPPPQPPQANTIPPESEFVAMLSKAAAAQLSAPSGEIVQPHPRAQESQPDAMSEAEPAPHDPLRALKAMSEHERIALFT